VKRAAVDLVVLTCAVVPLVACGSSGTFVTSPDLGPRAPWKFGSPLNVRAVTQALTKAGIHGLHLTQGPPAEPVIVLVEASRPGPMTLWVTVSRGQPGGAVNLIRPVGHPHSGGVGRLRSALQHTNFKNVSFVYVAKGRFLGQIKAAIAALKR
jgi:hypothetical protein